MVNRPPPRPGASGKNDDSDIPMSPGGGGGGGHYGRRKTKSSGPRRGLEWSLRSMHKIDTSAQHFLSNYYGGDDDDSDGGDSLSEDQTAYEIFKTKDDGGGEGGGNGGGNGGPGGGGGDSIWASLHAPLRTGIVDGKRVVFELRTNVTQRPQLSRQERLRRQHIILNSDRSGLEFRIRFWLMHFTVVTLSCLFLAIFIFMNVIFAGIFNALPNGKCCGDSDMTFGDQFAFSVQTSATIGYGSFSPRGMASNYFVVCLSYISTLINTLFAGLLFTKFVTPVINIQFSEVLTLCNVNGVPCLSFRLGNADGHENPLTDINVRLTYSYEIPYTDHRGDKRYFRQTDELRLLSSRQHGLLEPWTLRHVLDEASPLFGLNFNEHPANKIYVFTLSIDAVQELTKSTVNFQTEYGVEDVLIGHSFVHTKKIETEQHEDRKGNVGMTRIVISDYSKMSDTYPYPVWYPAKHGAYDTGDRLIPTKSFKP